MIVPALWRHVRVAISNAYWTIVNGVAVCLSGVTHGRDLTVRGTCRFMTRHHGDIVIGDGVTVKSRGFENAVGLMGPSIVDALCGGHIVIGDDTGMSSPIISSRSSISIGRRCKFGGNVRVFDHDFHSLEASYRSSTEDACHIRTKPIVVGDDVFIGTNAIILKGTHLGDRTIVAAGSVVFGLDAPADSLVKGNPAVVVARKAVC